MKVDTFMRIRLNSTKICIFTEEKFTISTFTTSDSDASDNETNRLTKNREKETKLRYSALSLICVLAKVR